LRKIGRGKGEGRDGMGIMESEGVEDRRKGGKEGKVLLAHFLE